MQAIGSSVTGRSQCLSKIQKASVRHIYGSESRLLCMQALTWYLKGRIELRFAFGKNPLHSQNPRAERYVWQTRQNTVLLSFWSCKSVLCYLQSADITSLISQRLTPNTIIWMYVLYFLVNYSCPAPWNLSLTCGPRLQPFFDFMYDVLYSLLSTKGFGSEHYRLKVRKCRLTFAEWNCILHRWNERHVPSVLYISLSDSFYLKPNNFEFYHSEPELSTSTTLYITITLYQLFIRAPYTLLVIAFSVTLFVMVTEYN